MDEICDVIILPGQHSIDIPSLSTSSSDLIRIPSKVTIVLTKPLKVKSVSLRFFGKHAVNAKFFDSPEVSNRKKTHKVPVLDVVVPLVKPGTTTLPKGETELAFDLLLPSDLPPSFESENGYLRYKATVTIIRTLGLALFRAKMFDKVVDVRGGLPLGVPRSVDGTATAVEQREPFTKRRGGIIEVRADFPSMLYADQNSTRVVTEMLFLSERCMPKSVTLSLEKVITVRTDSNDPHRPGRASQNAFLEKSSYSLVSNRNFWWPESNGEAVITPGTLKTISFRLELDPQKMGHYLATPLIDITHRFWVRIVFVHPWEEDLEFAVPVIVSPSTVPANAEMPNSPRRRFSEVDDDDDEYEDEPPSYDEVLRDPVPSGEFERRGVTI
ncbi:hypothetical protein BC936DRAFT_149944 [Jimgerdemannia flammicorona]|uniref:Arrestin-like N-terminal domain-containing protein n=1 Tax=Jimgerdemannia flammicorona TaxID=994334 RepID=A0A433CZV9_9FUNG|nr:hypothetical protein BC936DRAFT_149944 [Jimgerdemannia flammicorona]